jgi:hypothetical protein
MALHETSYEIADVHCVQCAQRSTKIISHVEFVDHLFTVLGLRLATLKRVKSVL